VAKPWTPAKPLEDFFSFDGLVPDEMSRVPRLPDYASATTGDLLVRLAREYTRVDALAGVTEYKAAICEVITSKEYTMKEYYTERIRNKRGVLEDKKMMRKKKIPASTHYKVWVAGICEVMAVPPFIGSPTDARQRKVQQAYLKLLPDAYTDEGDFHKYSVGDIVTLKARDDASLSSFTILKKVNYVSNIAGAISSLAPGPTPVLADVLAATKASVEKCKYEDEDIVIPLTIKGVDTDIEKFFKQWAESINYTFSSANINKAKEVGIILGIMSYFSNSFALEQVTGQDRKQLVDPTQKKYLDIWYDETWTNIQAERFGNTLEGDGKLFLRRGFFGLVGRKNYNFYSEASMINIESSPNIILDIEIALNILTVFLQVNIDILQEYFEDQENNKRNLYKLLFIDQENRLQKGLDESITKWIKIIKDCKVSK